MNIWEYLERNPLLVIIILFIIAGVLERMGVL